MAHPLVTRLSAGLNTPGNGPLGIPPGSGAALTYAYDIPRLIMFAGFLGDPVPRPDGPGMWDVLYLDLELTHWLLVEDGGIVERGWVRDNAVPFNRRRDVIWVTSDTVVGHGTRSLSIEGQFLTGDFTRAGDFEAPLGGGTTGASTGVFCEARTPTCCRYPSRP